jgi:hypothetical protein
MDIQVSSNFERLLFELLGRDAPATAETMRRFRAEGRMPVPDAAWRSAAQLFREAMVRGGLHWRRYQEEFSLMSIGLARGLGKRMLRR